MNIKTIIATAALTAIGGLAAAPAAKADPHVGFSIGFGFADQGFGHAGYGYDRGEDQFWGRRHEHRHMGYRPYPQPYANYGIGCGAGANVVRASGFDGVQVVNCAGPIYTYQAWRRGQPFRVVVSTSGRIVQVSRSF